MFINSLIITEIQAKLENLQPLEPIPVEGKAESDPIWFSPERKTKNQIRYLLSYESVKNF